MNQRSRSRGIMSLKVRPPAISRSLASTELAGIDQQLSPAEAIGGVEFQEPGRGAAHRCQARNRGAVPGEVLLPAIGAWLEEPRDDASVGIDAGEVGPLPEVTFGTGQREVLDGFPLPNIWQKFGDATQCDPVRPTATRLG